MTPLDPNRVRRAFPGRRIDYYPTIDSTMKAAAQLDPGAVVIAEEQTAGQGRHGHAWHSEPYAGIYCSLVTRQAPVLTLAMGLAARAAILEATGLTCDLRWPNDLLLGGRKVVGILAQAAGANAVAGIGINANHEGFPPELAALATSLRMESGREVSREAVLVALIHAVDEFTRFEKDEILRRFTGASSYAHGLRVTVDLPDGVLEGVTAGLNPDGFLIVRKPDGTETLILAGGVRAAGA
jgi:BirA family transcriptional regulator, biotin operon repressor / biotin---[acetyl-CoA-carboxylase] ligase